MKQQGDSNSETNGTRHICPFCAISIREKIVRYSTTLEYDDGLDFLTKTSDIALNVLLGLFNAIKVCILSYIWLLAISEQRAPLPKWRRGRIWKQEETREQSRKLKKFPALVITLHILYNFFLAGYCVVWTSQSWRPQFIDIAKLSTFMQNGKGKCSN